MKHIKENLLYSPPAVIRLTVYRRLHMREAMLGQLAIAVNLRVTILLPGPTFFLKI